MKTTLKTKKPPHSNTSKPFFTPSIIQTKLAIGQSGDKYEREADMMAEKVVQKMDDEENEMGINRKAIFEGDNSISQKYIQRKEVNEVDPNVESQLHRSKGSGRRLGDSSRQLMERSFGADFTGVKIHTDSRAIQMTRELGAKAFTNGSDIYFNSGYYNPTTREGGKLLAHELTHTIQQGGSTKTIQADFAVEPTTPNRRVPNLTAAQIQSAITFNQAKHTDTTEIALIRDILGISKTPAVIDEDFVNAVVRYQSQYGLNPDGKLAHQTADRIAQEIIAEGDFLGQGNLGSLAPEFALKTSLNTLISANNTAYADYKAAIQGATMIQGHVALRDQQLLRDIRGQLSWNNWARCIELMGRIPPTYHQLIRNGTVRAALGAAWTASDPAVNPPVVNQHEEGGWVFLNLVTGDISVRRAPRGAGAAIDLTGPPTVVDSIVVGVFHTHPNLGPGWIAGPSPEDRTIDAADGIPDIVVGSNDIDPATFDLFHSGPIRRRHLAGNRGLPAGSLAPQAKADGSYDEK